MCGQGYVNLLTPDLLDALRACLSDAQQSVKLEAVVCLRQIFHTHAETHLDELQRQVSTFLPAVQALVSEDWYKLTIEGLRSVLPSTVLNRCPHIRVYCLKILHSI